MLICAAIVPHPLLLVPEIARAESADVAQLRSSCLMALDSILAAAPEVVHMLGTGPDTSTYRNAIADFRPWGVDLQVPLPEAVPQEPSSQARGRSVAELPLSLAVGAWLVAQREWSSPIAATSISTDESLDSCVRLGADLAASGDRLALLIMSDGAACRSETGPRPYDARGATYDAEVGRALRSGDGRELAALDADLAGTVSTTGLNPLRALAGAADEAIFDTQVTYDAAPFGVGYCVAVWERHG